MPDAIALIPTDLQHSRLGLPSRLAHTVAGKTVLEHTLSRVSQVESITQIILVHPAGQNPLNLVSDIKRLKLPVVCHTDDDGLTDRFHHRRTSGRKWAMNAWRGGLGGTTCYDELLPAKPLANAMQAFGAESALLVGADWMLVDSEICTRILDLHLEYPEDMAMTFSQAPPGLAGIAVARKIIDELHNQSGLIGSALSYQPSHPQGDPIGRDVCVQIESGIRDCVRRFIYDTSRSAQMIDAIAETLDNNPDTASAEHIVDALHTAESKRNGKSNVWGDLPQQITLELTAKRTPTSPTIPQHHVTLNRNPIGIEHAKNIITQVAQTDDCVLKLAGLGDALLHPQWQEIVRFAAEAGVFGIALETDLLSDENTLQSLLDLPIDVIVVNINADSQAVYEKVMGIPGEQGFTKVQDNIIWLLEQRSQMMQNTEDRWFWVIPQLVKTVETLADMEPFFDRWTHFAGHAVIRPPLTGQSNDGPLMPDQNLVQMCPPRRSACRQLDRRMTILCDGRVARCDQDWLGDAAAANLETETLEQAWNTIQTTAASHNAGEYEGICTGCCQWHRP